MVLCVLSSFAINMAEEERAGCNTFIVFLTSCDCCCSLPLLYGAVGLSAVYDCGISWSYLLPLPNTVLYCVYKHQTCSHFRYSLYLIKCFNRISLIFIKKKQHDVSCVTKQKQTKRSTIITHWNTYNFSIHFKPNLLNTLSKRKLRAAQTF